VVVSCLPSFRILLSARSRSDSAYKRRNPSSSDRSVASKTRKRSTLRRTSTIRLEAINAGAYLDTEQGKGQSFDHIISAAERERPNNTIITKSSRGESQEEILPPRNRVLVRQDVVSETHLNIFGR